MLAARHVEKLNDLLTEALMVVKENLINGEAKTKMHVALQLLKMSGLQGFAKIMLKEEMSEKEMMISIMEEVLPEVNEEIRMRYSCKYWTSRQIIGSYICI